MNADEHTMNSNEQDGGEVVVRGERYAKSPLDGSIYRVTKWIDDGDGKIRAREKELVDRDDVPGGVLAQLDGDGVNTGEHE